MQSSPLKRFTVRQRRCAPGLTLLELLLVLVILTVVATIAVESIEPKVDQSRFEATQQTIQNFDEAIAAEKTNTDGSHFYSGYVIDIGGLPLAQEHIADANVLTASSLWVNPGLAVFSIRPASTGNVANIDGTNEDLDGQTVDADSDITVATGWRGPYLHLPVGGSELTDAWGTGLHAFVDDSDFSYLRGVGDTDIDAAGEKIIGVRSLGRDDLIGGTDYDMDLPVSLALSEDKLAGTVRGTVLIQGVAAAPPVDQVIVQLYYPDAPTGLIRVERGTIQSLGSPAENEHEFEYEFRDEFLDEVRFPVGPRVIRAYFDKTTTDDVEDYASKASVEKSRAKYFTILPTTNGGIDLTIDATE